MSHVTVILRVSFKIVLILSLCVIFVFEIVLSTINMSEVAKCLRKYNFRL